MLSWQERKALQVEFAVGDAKGLEEWAREYSQLQGEESLFLPVEHSIEKTYALGVAVFAEYFSCDEGDIPPLSIFAQ